MYADRWLDFGCLKRLFLEDHERSALIGISIFITFACFWICRGGQSSLTFVVAPPVITTRELFVNTKHRLAKVTSFSRPT